MVSEGVARINAVLATESKARHHVVASRLEVRMEGAMAAQMA
jgi:hypothetical protein